MTSKVGIRTESGEVSIWTEARITKSLLSIAGTFELRLTVPGNARFSATDLFGTGLVTVTIDDEVVLEGYVFSPVAEITAQSRTLVVEGREKTADLVDCQIVEAFELKNVTFDIFVTKVLQPFGLTFKSSRIFSTKRDYALRPGADVWTELVRAARIEGVLLYSNGRGSVTADEIGKDALPGAYIREGENVLSGKVVLDHSQRYSDYYILAQGKPSADSFGTTQVVGHYHDATIKRHRPRVMVSDATLTSEQATARAKWEAQNAASRGFKSLFRLPGFRTPKGALWRENRLVETSSSKLALDRTLLITTVAYHYSDGAAYTLIELADPNTFVQDPTAREQEKPIGDELGERFQ